MRTPEEIADGAFGALPVLEQLLADIAAFLRSRDAEHAATIRLLARAVIALLWGNDEVARELLTGLDLDELSKEAE